MPSIQWFPGHMHAARGKLRQALADIDVLIEVLDARIPAASRNPMLEAMWRERGKPTLKVLNKADLADPARTRQWLQALAREPQTQALAISAHRPAEVRRVVPAAQALAPHRGTALKPLRLLIAGIPNVGKSTLINALLGRKAAKVADEPAVTRALQRYELSPSCVLFDSPGLMWPKIAHDSDGFLLAACHAIGRNAVTDSEVAQALIMVLQEEGYGDRLCERYRLSPPEAMLAHEWLVMIARRRGCVLAGGLLDTEKAAQGVLQDFREGKLGRITLETPSSRAQRLARDMIEIQNREADDNDDTNPGCQRDDS